MPKKSGGRDGIQLRAGHFHISYVDGHGRRRREATAAQTLTQARAIRAQKMQDAEKAKVLGYAPPSETLSTTTRRATSSTKRPALPSSHTSAHAALWKANCTAVLVRHGWLIFAA
jgi:hypothetical protein